jgi:hypothetical protein
MRTAASRLGGLIAPAAVAVAAPHFDQHVASGVEVFDDARHLQREQLAQAERELGLVVDRGDQSCSRSDRAIW